jgi:hypothetical protein
MRDLRRALCGSALQQALSSKLQGLRDGNVVSSGCGQKVSPTVRVYEGELRIAGVGF